MLEVMTCDQIQLMYRNTGSSPKRRLSRTSSNGLRSPSKIYGDPEMLRFSGLKFQNARRRSVSLFFQMQMVFLMRLSYFIACLLLLSNLAHAQETSGDLAGTLQADRGDEIRVADGQRLGPGDAGVGRP